MPDPEQVRTVVREWVGKAENDLETVKRLLDSGSGYPTDSVCFHSQQCVEKYLKALLTLAEIPFPKSHDIRLLISLIPGNVGIDVSLEDQRTLTAYRHRGKVSRSRRYPEIGSAQSGTPGSSAQGTDQSCSSQVRTTSVRPLTTASVS